MTCGPILTFGVVTLTSTIQDSIAPPMPVDKAYGESSPTHPHQPNQIHRAGDTRGKSRSGISDGQGDGLASIVSRCFWHTQVGAGGSMSITP